MKKNSRKSLKFNTPASAGTIERRGQIRKDSRGRNQRRRILHVVEERYVVVLQQRKNKEGELDFITAFTADASYIRQIKQNSALLETKKPFSNLWTNIS